MASKESTNSKLCMKLLVNSKTQHVLYAEAGKDVVDFLFSLLTMPVGTVVKLLTSDSMVGSVGNLYGSVDRLGDTYICREDAKNVLLTPVGGCHAGKLLQLPEPETEAAVLYQCDDGGTLKCRKYVTEVSGVLCPKCQASMTAPMQLLVKPDDGVGFVQGIVTYTVMDDLSVAPMSSISWKLEHPPEQICGLRHRLAPGEDCSTWLRRGTGGTEGLAAVKDSSH